MSHDRFHSQQAELTFCAGDVIIVYGQIDEDGFYYVSTKCFARLQPVCLSSECFSTCATAAMLDSEGQGKWLRTFDSMCA